MPEHSPVEMVMGSGAGEIFKKNLNAEGFFTSAALALWKGNTFYNHHKRRAVMGGQVLPHLSSYSYVIFYTTYRISPETIDSIVSLTVFYEQKFLLKKTTQLTGKKKK